MELQLGLSLSSYQIKDFDLNKNHLGFQTWSLGCCLGSDNKTNKRCFDEAFEMTKEVSQTLPLLSWNDQPNDEDDPKNLDKLPSCTIKKVSNGEGNCIVGWPPIKTWRRKLQYYKNEGGGPRENGRREEREKKVSNGELRSMYVKVKMEGVVIGRKVDLSLHHSYQTLTDTLIGMFGKDEESEKESKQGEGTSYTITYQDLEGDWLLIGDVPWQTFIQSVKRLKIIRNGVH